MVHWMSLVLIALGQELSSALLPKPLIWSMKCPFLTLFLLAPSLLHPVQTQTALSSQIPQKLSRSMLGKHRFSKSSLNDAEEAQESHPQHRKPTALVFLFLFLLPAPRWVLMQSHLSFLQPATEDTPSPKIHDTGIKEVSPHILLSLQVSLVWCWNFPAAFLARSSYLNQWLPNEATNRQGALYSAALWYSKFSCTCRIIISHHLMRTVIHSQSDKSLCLDFVVHEKDPMGDASCLIFKSS